MSDIAQKSLEFARELQVKFELYFTGLIFTLLAASIQTAKFTENAWPNALELFGWISLLIAGLAGLSRLEWMPNNYETNARLSMAKETTKQWKAARDSGRRIVDEELQPWDAAIKIPEQEAKIAEVVELDEKRSKYSMWKHDTRKWAFLVGLCFVIGARAYDPILTIVQRVSAA